jgi:hypothetical protein
VVVDRGCLIGGLLVVVRLPVVFARDTGRLCHYSHTIRAAAAITYSHTVRTAAHDTVRIVVAHEPNSPGAAAAVRHLVAVAP